MTAIKNLLKEISFTEARIIAAQKKLAVHKQFFDHLLRDKTTSIYISLITSFISGWQLGKVKLTKKNFWRVGKFIFFSLLSKVRRVA